jgi:hypothetical protein
MRKILESLKTRVQRANERDRKLEKPIEKVSRLLWPWPESKPQHIRRAAIQFKSPGV